MILIVHYNLLLRTIDSVCILDMPVVVCRPSYLFFSNDSSETKFANSINEKCYTAPQKTDQGWWLMMGVLPTIRTNPTHSRWSLSPVLSWSSRVRFNLIWTLDGWYKPQAGDMAIHILHRELNDDVQVTHTFYDAVSSLLISNQQSKFNWISSKLCLTTMTMTTTRRTNCVIRLTELATCTRVQLGKTNDCGWLLWVNLWCVDRDDQYWGDGEEWETSVSDWLTVGLLLAF